ncbi:MAG: 2-amino-4-hydroxy-6-hydroxymethyldihydropteridine diphosphokinase [Synechococcales cyanobacterium C42_A2020_086]|jgi:2-amino-4-hydroxy-6-hydroxymethyldihydropteridine diphosphokinase|nr:2-amino-4-hydroxy-6-hydroxymethyldihydropteridine diphosphokinase [Synechococcales cyanobacterium C42_A2020_086]
MSVSFSKLEQPAIHSPAEGSTTHRAAIALGSNLGEPAVILKLALKQLAQTPGLILQAQSPFYQTVAVGPPQPDYLNACALLGTTLTPQDLLATLLSIEADFGRVRRERWGPRLLDLDLLLFDQVILNHPNLTLPHPHLTERAFVLVPLSDIAPDWREPVSGMTILDLVQRVDCSGVKPYSAD